MSHFTVLVIGANIEAQLAPYHEFECTGDDNQYVKDIDVTSKVMERLSAAITAGSTPAEAAIVALQYHGLDKVVVASETEVDRTGPHKFGYAVVQHGALIKAVQRTNPNRKWDWYQIGGRWAGFLKLKPGATGVVGERSYGYHPAEPGYADQATKGDVDIAGMRDIASAEAGALWDKARALTGGQTWESWNTVLTRFGKDKVDEARNFYHDQPAVKALKESGDDSFGWSFDDELNTPRDAYVQAKRDNALATFAVVYKGEWTERGRMGWFGCASDEMDQAKWSQLFNELLDGLPDDTLLTVVDCHI